MQYKLFSVITISISFLAFWYLSTISLTKITERHTCPYCYGEDYCYEVENELSLSFNSLNALTFNLLSVKNVYFANDGRQDVVVKKLASASKLTEMLKKLPMEVQAIDLKSALIDPHRDFQVCNNQTALKFLQTFRSKNHKNLWTIVNINAEPLLLEIFDHKQFPVPKLLGYCGRAVVEQHSGDPLTSIEKFDWYKRALVAKQVLEAADKFTFGHKDFRLYLTDISPDNIVVNDDLGVSFVDLGNAILVERSSVLNGTHYTEPFNEDQYGFSRQDICEKSVSDHNVYAVCKLLLSVTAPWPMMLNGLLHSPPSNLNVKELFELIEKCVFTKERVSRFVLSSRIRGILSEIIQGKT